MPEKIGEIQKPEVKDFKKGRKLYFVPLVFGGKDSPEDYLKIISQYWKQVEKQIEDLESKLGSIKKVYHELTAVGGKEGLDAIEALNEESHKIAKKKIEKGGQLQATEGSETLTEFMDWGRCLALGLQNQKVISTIYQSYVEAVNKRNESIAKRLDETLKEDEIGILFMREGHQVQFPADIQVFYVAPPALDEINRWLRDNQSQIMKETDKEEKDSNKDTSY